MCSAKYRGCWSNERQLLLATAALAIVDVAAETITFATAGHPPPLLRLPDGQVEMLDTANGPIIGIANTGHVADTALFPSRDPSW